MYRLRLDATPVKKTEVEFYKVDDNLNGIQGVKFTLTDVTDSTLVYPLTSGDNGKVRVKLTDGTYILKETAAGGGFAKTDNVWEVKVSNNTFNIDLKEKPDENSKLGQFESGDNYGKYYITNHILGNAAKLELEKKFVDQNEQETTAPSNLDHIKVKLEGTYRDEKPQTYFVTLRYNEQRNKYVGSANVISYFDYKITEEHLYKDFDEKEEISSDSWELSDWKFNRFEDSTITLEETEKDCASLARAIQDYEFLIIKTANAYKFASQYYLILNHADTISESVREKIIDGSSIGGISYADTKVIDFADIPKEFARYIQVIPGASGSNTLKFNDLNAWAMFQVGNMDIQNYTINGTITNMLKTMDIKITKTWVDAEDNLEKRPKEILVKIINSKKEVYETIKLSETNNWEKTIEGLPIDSYTVEEVDIPGYTSEIVVDEEKNIYNITNTLQADWNLYKISKNKGADGKDLPLSGAVFELYKNDNGNKGEKIATFNTQEDGKAIISYEGSHSKIEDGEYFLKETVAPDGYVVNDITLKIWIKDGIITKYEPDKSDALGISKEITSNENGSFTVLLKVENTPLYELPSTGGSGIFVYTIGGTLLLMAAALLIYKMKREEVLKG